MSLLIFDGYLRLLACSCVQHVLGFNKQQHMGAQIPTTNVAIPRINMTARIANLES